MKNKVCVVAECKNEGTVAIGITTEGKKREVLICQKCWEDLTFNRTALKFKATEKN